jgi:DNA-binding CsgD family transcriptional regulator
VYARAGETARAEAILDGMDAARFADIKVVMQAAEARSWLLVARGRGDAAARIVAEAAEWGVQRGHPALAALTAFVAVAQGSGDRVADVLERIAESSDARLVQAHARHARALAEGDAQGLDDVAGDYLAFAHPLGAALAFAAAARQWERAGQAERARVSGRSLTLLGSVEGTASSGVLADRLTARELEVALAAARRERSREIASRWGVSVRTVEHQLGAAYRKLGVSSRDELRDVLLRSGVLAEGSAGEHAGVSASAP